ATDSTFDYDPLKLSAPTFANKLTATLTITNTGRVTGRAVVQLYLSAPAGNLAKPTREFKAFAKTALLAPGKSQTLTNSLGGGHLHRAGGGVVAPHPAAGYFSATQAGSGGKSRPLLKPQAPIMELQAKQQK
ncbi:MAG: hypothetical protein EOO36_23290, partial [Cytophagaceae bacterium]